MGKMWITGQKRPSEIFGVTSFQSVPEIGGFPVPLQKLLAVELEAVEERTLAGRPTPVFEQHLKCNCRFARRYFLPCRHIFHLDGEDKVLTPPVWKIYVSLFEGGGFEVYEAMGWVDVEERPAVQESIKTRSVLELREIEERLWQQLYTVGNYGRGGNRN